MPHFDSDPFVAQLGELCRERPTVAKWVIVSSHAAGLTLGDRLARDGTSWTHLHLVTPIDLAVRMAGPFLLEAGVDPTDDTLGPAVMLRILAEVRGEADYYREVDHHPSMADAWWRTLQELRLAGLSSVDLVASAFEHPVKHAAVQAVVQRYEALLRDEHRADRATVFETALRHATYCPLGADDVRIEQPHVVWAPLVRRFLDALPGHAVHARSLDVPGLDAPARARALMAPLESVAVPEPASGAARLVSIRRPGTAPLREAEASSCEVFRAGGILAEADAVLRRVVRSSRRFDEIEIACGHEEQALLVWEKAIRLDWPVTLSTGVPAHLTQPGRALAAYCRWLESTFAARVAIDALQDGAWRPAALATGADTVSVSPSQAARVITKAAPAWGRATYRLSLERLIARERARAVDLDLEAAARERAAEHRDRAARVLAWITSLLDEAPAIDGDADVSIAAVVEAARAAVAGMVSRASALDRLAASALDAALAELRGLGDRRAPLSTALRFIEEQVAQVRVGRDRPRPGALHVGLLRDAGLDGRPCVCVMGLEEGMVLPTVIEDPILLDAERLALSPVLATSRSRLDEAVWLTTRRLAEIGVDVQRLGGTLTLSYSCRDVRQFRDTSPTALLLHAFRAIHGRPGASVSDMERVIGRLETAVPTGESEATSDAAWWLHAFSTRPDAAGEVERVYPWLREGRRLEVMRGGWTAGAADGIVAAAAMRLDPSRSGVTVSASTLEAAATCPFRYFVQYGLGVRAPDDREREASAWLDPLTRGSALHDLFARLMREVRAEGGAFDAARHGSRLRVLGDEMLARLRIELPPPSDTVYDRERADFLHDLDLFAQQEARRGAIGIGFEVAFGLDDEGRDPEWTRPDPIVIDLGDGRAVRIRGSIDRIDRVGDNVFEVIDYKTGGFFPDDWDGTFDGATRLQHAIYAAAAEEVLRDRHPGARVTRSTYWFPSARGRQVQKATDDNTTARTADVLRDVCDALATGAFLQAEAAPRCKFCDFETLCGKDPYDRAGRKLANPDNTVLAAFRRMRRHD